ncbi:MAG: DUF6090 family protein [Cryomorphaceae bacterium]
MAKVFGKKRAELLVNEKFKQYLKYAIGEIVLVVIGILIAVGINNWNIETGNRSQEVKILNQLLVEYETNLEEIDKKIEMRNLIMKSVEQLIYYADNGIDAALLDSVSFHFNRTKYDPTFDPANGVTNELLNSGKFYLIQNEELKSELTSWSGAAGELIEQEQLTAKLVYQDYIPYLIENFDHRSTMNQEPDNKMNQLFAKGQSRTLNVPRKMSQGVFEQILGDNTFQNYVIIIGRMHQAGNRQSLDTRKKILGILEIIKSEIELGKD